MDFAIFIPITLFACITYAIKVVVDARVRRQLISAGGSQELVRSIVAGEDLRRRNASLQWGLILVALAIGFGVIQALGWESMSPGLIAILAGATGLGNLAFFAVVRKGQ
jgi:predicted outer membrane lipoprotein